MDVQQVLAEVKAVVDAAHAQETVIDSSIAAHKRTAETLEVIANRTADEKALVSAEELLTAMAQEMRAKTEELEAALKANTPAAMPAEGPKDASEHGDDKANTTADPAAVQPAPGVGDSDAARADAAAGADVGAGQAEGGVAGA